MTEPLGDVADSVGSVGGRVTQGRHASASAQLVIACRPNIFDEMHLRAGLTNCDRLPSTLHHFLATTAPALFLCECGSRVAPMRTLIAFK